MASFHKRRFQDIFEGFEVTIEGYIYNHNNLPITAEMANAIKALVVQLIPNGTLGYDGYYTEHILSYATGNRKGIDDEGCGEGILYAYNLILALYKAGIACFSGLHVPPGKDWKTYMLRLEGSRSKAKTLVVVSTNAFYHSKPCLHEVAAAMEAKCLIDVLNYELPLPLKKDQWPLKVIGQDPNDELMSIDVKKRINRVNSYPPPPLTFLTDPNAMNSFVSMMVERLDGIKKQPTNTNTLLEELRPSISGDGGGGGVVAPVHTQV
mmetsp:Transcript_38499/g.49811  ORF Transcript_38499/g.49811 Transcript_38499/m.49811 type:complete len:265 (+) Transcript_38499:144-938(+)